jgi:hypothetical protein
MWAMVGGIARRLAEALYDVGRGWEIGIADAEADDVDASRLQRILFLVDLCEQVGWKLLNSLRFLDFQTSSLRAAGFGKVPITRSSNQLQTLAQFRRRSVTGFCFSTAGSLAEARSGRV